MSQRRIVHVDDNQDYCGVIRWNFRSVAPDVEVKSIYDGEDAITHFELCGTGGIPVPDLLLVDLMMPGVCGLDVVRAVRRLPQFAQVPVYILSANKQPEDIHLACQAGADGHIGKPPGEEKQLVRDILELSPWRRSEIAQELSNALVPLVSPTIQLVASSPAMTHAPALQPPTGVLQFIAQAAVYLRDVPMDSAALQGLFTNPDEADITYAERQARIDRWEVQDTSDKEHQMETKRREFYGILIERRWGLSQIRKRFPCASVSYLEKIRADLHKSRKDRATAV